MSELDRALARAVEAPDLVTVRAERGLAVRPAVHDGLQLALAATAAARRLRREGLPGDPQSVGGG